jgi:hypothetical protein
MMQLMMVFIRQLWTSFKCLPSPLLAIRNGMKVESGFIWLSWLVLTLGNPAGRNCRMKARFFPAGLRNASVVCAQPAARLLSFAFPPARSKRMHARRR